MSKARDLANLASDATNIATDSELAGIDLTNVQRIVPVDSNISVPGAPTSVSATVASGQSSVSFVAPTDNGGSTILSYTVISSPGNIKKSGSSSPIIITGLTNGTAYTFTVKAHNIAGSSTASSASGSVTPIQIVTADYLVLAGGGGGGGGDSQDYGAGGGGAGGLRSTVTATGGGGSLESALALSLSTNYTVTVGAGGAGGAGGTTNNSTDGTQGVNSVFSTITSTGGGFGGKARNTTSTAGGSGGSGGGAGGRSSVVSGGTRTASPVQGFDGGSHPGNFSNAGAGGGGASAVGTNVTAYDIGGNGGNGIASSITGTSVTYGGGGGGAATTTRGTGGTGGGGNGAQGTNVAGDAGTANRGGGGGASGGGSGYNGGAGGSGVVILRYLTTDGTITIGAGLTGSTATDGSYKVTTLTAGTGNVSWA